jgi:hypothetical protein
MLDAATILMSVQPRFGTPAAAIFILGLWSCILALLGGFAESLSQIAPQKSQQRQRIHIHQHGRVRDFVCPAERQRAV